jgi:hypothetical protein
VVKGIMTNKTNSLREEFEENFRVNKYGKIEVLMLGGEWQLAYLTDIEEFWTSKLTQILEEASEIICQLTDDDECRLDHHGYCQTHCWFDKSLCINKRAKQYRDKWLRRLK